MWLENNQLQSLPDSFPQLKVGGDLRLNNNQLRSLPDGFANISVGGNMYLGSNPLALTEYPSSFPNVRGRVFQ